MEPAWLLRLGRRRYAEAWSLQRALHAAIAAGDERLPSGGVWIVVEHDQVVTIGRQGKTESLLLSRDALAARGVDVHEIERGGDVTYHGPGQVVVYPIRRLARFREIVPLVRSLEGAVIATCARYGIDAERWSEHAGVWVGRDQICAIGLAVRQMTSLHGIALNASTELSYDRLINPCGLTDRGITSLSALVGRTVHFEDAANALSADLAKTFDLDFRVVEPGVDLSLEAIAAHTLETILQ